MEHLMTTYHVVTIEYDGDGKRHTVNRYGDTSLFYIVNAAKRYGWLPGDIPDRRVITETRFVSVP
jgi:ABC-type nitrate/sulfonate/bicarbonate transport system substrate-binding protein